MTDRETERQKLNEAMARVIFDAEWDRPGNAATESEREPMWRVFRRKYCQLAEAALTAIAEQGYAVVPRIPGAETVASLLAGNAAVRAADVDGRLLDWLVGADLAFLPNNQEPMIVVTPLPSTERRKATTWCPLRVQVWERSVREHRCLWSGWFVDDLQIKLGKGGHLGVAILVRPVVGAGSP